MSGRELEKGSGCRACSIWCAFEILSDITGFGHSQIPSRTPNLIATEAKAVTGIPWKNRKSNLYCASNAASPFALKISEAVVNPASNFAL